MIFEIIWLKYESDLLCLSQLKCCGCLGKCICIWRIGKAPGKEAGQSFSCSQIREVGLYSQRNGLSLFGRMLPVEYTFSFSVKDSNSYCQIINERLKYKKFEHVL